MTGHEIRQEFLDFFAARGHRVVPSSPLVPANDPTLLFANAGMNQFKDVFLGAEKRDYSRAATSQKCVRAGGKHNDLENVGYTRRHHTFFEMLGNFSFGDYFKADAISLAWDLITKDYGIPKDRLYFTVFREDDEAELLWRRITGVSESRIFRLGEKDNFWQMGETGPCGPCSEIHYDLGPDAPEPGHEGEAFPSDCGGRFVEIWNLVFMQFNRDTSGTLTPLPRPSIDTGMGLERIAAVMQGKLSNFECDLLAPLIVRAAELFGVAPGEDARVDTSLRIAADHARATAFLIHEGVLPSNEGRGYVLRKIMRRAMRNARLVGVVEPFLCRLTGFVAELMKPAYPELLESAPRVARVVKDEEDRYRTTFQVAERIFHDEASAVSGGVLPGPVAFKLYDTYGLALDEQAEMAREYSMTVDLEGFEREMERQRERARASWKGAPQAQVSPVYQDLADRRRTRFLGYDTLETGRSRIAGIVVDQRLADEIRPGERGEVILDETPFYAEAGGQVGDTGRLWSAETGREAARVEGAYPAMAGLTAHRVLAVETLRVGDIVRAGVDSESRHATMRNHTATHLLHAALRRVLGEHVKQAGSVVEPARLRFDFTHYAAVDAAELDEIERLINEQILLNTEVETQLMGLDEAISAGAVALFGEKYGDTVRVLSVPGFSRELCGGTHVRRTGDIGLCKILYEGSISAGVRRIEAITGTAALERFRELSRTLARVGQMVRAPEAEVAGHIERLQAAEKALQRQVEHLKRKVAQAQLGELEEQARTLKGVRVLAGRVDGLDREQMRALADSLRNKWKTAVVVLASAEDSSVLIVSAVTKDVTSKVHAGKLAGSLAQALGGKGGGRPDMAEAGARDAAGLGAALDRVYAQVEALL
ncbi:MAG: alanine--tRNA ligase [Bryobacterales bacterium]|nr:alanine--tRNA ligase [Bryobacterales bacterium]